MWNPTHSQPWQFVRIVTNCILFCVHGHKFDILTVSMTFKLTFISIGSIFLNVVVEVDTKFNDHHMTDWCSQPESCLFHETAVRLG